MISDSTSRRVFDAMKSIQHSEVATLDVERTIEDAQRAHLLVICAWCRIVIHAGPQPVSHGMCSTCQKQMLEAL